MFNNQFYYKSLDISNFLFTQFLKKNEKHKHKHFIFFFSTNCDIFFVKIKKHTVTVSNLFD